MQEDARAYNSFFVTFTYDTDHVPISDSGFMTLRKRDFQLFMKRLRKHEHPGVVKYYCVGEYGTKTWRPHFHAIMYNVDIAKVEEEWYLGAVHVGDVTQGSAAYTVKYISKEKRIPHFSGDDRVPEFSLMSKGLGSGYLSDEVVRWHKRSFDRNFVTIPGGGKLSMPRYYRNKIFDEDELIQFRNHARRRVFEEEDISRAEFERDFPGQSYDEYIQAAKAARYKSFYHFQNQNRGL